MGSRPHRPIFVLALTFLLTLLTAYRAPADTYKIFQIADYNGAAPIDYLDNKGDVVIEGSFLSGMISECPFTINTCYGVFQPFGSFYHTPTLPPFDYTGTVVFVPSGTSPTLFNNGYEVYYDAATRALYGGPIGNLVTLKISTDLADRLAINDYGDIAWTDGFYEINYLAYDVTAHATPEPTSFLLLASGLATLGLATFIRRKPAAKSV